MINPPKTIDTLAGLVLAAGGSTRLGRPKQLVNYRGQPLICKALDAVGTLCGAGLIVVSGANAVEVEAAIAAYPVRVVHNACWEEGISGSIATGIAALSGTCFEALLIMLCDQPLVGSQDIAKLAEVWQNAPTRPAAAFYHDSVGVPAIFPAAYMDALTKLKGDSGARALLKKELHVSSVEMPAAVFDIDTQDDLLKLPGL